MEKDITFYSISIFIILAGFTIMEHIAISPFSDSTMYVWIRGYLGESFYGNNLKLENIPIAWKTALGTVLTPTYGRARYVRVAIFAFLIGSSLVGITQIKQLDREKRIILLSACLQYLVSWLLIIWFEPWYPKFWVLTLAPGLIILACCVDALVQRLRLWLKNFSHYEKFYSPLIAILGLIVALFNIKYAIVNQLKPDEIAQETMNIWLEHSEPDDMLITAGDLIPQLWFWSNRPNTIHLYHYLVVNEHSDDRFEYIRDQINQFLCNGDAVLFAPAIVDNFDTPFLLWLNLSRDELCNFFDSYQKEKYFTYKNPINGEETQVYKLSIPSACSQ